MQVRQALRLNSIVQMFAVLAIAVLVNTLASTHFFRLDLTGDRVHTLSQAARHLVGGLERPMVVKVFFTGGLEAPYNNHEQILVDKLEEYRAWSSGLLEVEVVDPTGNPELEAEAQRLGVQPIQYRFRSAQRSELRQVYMGLVMIYGDGQEVLPAITQVDSVEYELARAMKTLMDGPERATVGFTTGHQEVDLLREGGPMETLRARLAESVDLVPVTLGGAAGVPEAIDLLLVVGPKQPVGLRAQYQIDQYLMGGGPVALFLNNWRPDLRTYRAQQVFHGLEPWLGHHGIRLNRDIVIDRSSNGQLRFPIRQGKFVVQTPVDYPLIPKSTDLADDSLVVKGLDSMLFPFASSLEISDDLQAGAEATIIARASTEAGRVQGLARVDPPAFRQRLSSEEVGAWPLAVSLRGEFRSFFGSREIPPAPASLGGGGMDAPLIADSSPTRLVAVGSADMVANNLAFVLNLVDWMLQDEALISIRSRSVQVPELRPMSADEALSLKLINLLLPTLLLLLAGGVRHLYRRRS